MLPYYFDAAFEIFVVTCGFSLLFILLRFGTIEHWFTLLFSNAQVQPGFDSAKSWASNLTVFISFMGVALPLISGQDQKAQQQELQALNFFYSILFAQAVVLYLASRRIFFFLIADFFVLWSVFGTTCSLWYAIYIIHYIPIYAQWLLIVMLPIGMVLLAYYIWTSSQDMIEQLKTEMVHPKDVFPNLKWIIR